MLDKPNTPRRPPGETRTIRSTIGSVLSLFNPIGLARNLSQDALTALTTEIHLVLAAVELRFPNNSAISIIRTRINQFEASLLGLSTERDRYIRLARVLLLSLMFLIFIPRPSSEAKVSELLERLSVMTDDYEVVLRDLTSSDVARALYWRIFFDEETKKILGLESEPEDIIGTILSSDLTQALSQAAAVESRNLRADAHLNIPSPEAFEDVVKDILSIDLELEQGRSFVITYDYIQIYGDRVITIERFENGDITYTFVDLGIILSFQYNQVDGTYIFSASSTAEQNFDLDTDPES